jgi:homoserine dehydrogenase
MERPASSVGGVSKVSEPVINVALLGCGNVGAALVELLCDPARSGELRSRTGLDLRVAGIGVHDVSKQRSSEPWFPTDLVTDDLAGLVGRSDVDLVVELMGGIEPAASLIQEALRGGKSVVSANKALLAEQGPELMHVAIEHGVDLRFEAAVAGAIPVIRTLRESLAGESVTRVLGIVNGTTNYILSKMAHDGGEYADVLAEAMDLGLAERDPTADVEGLDAAAKAAILASLAFGSDVPLDRVAVEGISKIRSVDVAFARQFGYAIKLLAIAELIGDDEISVRVHPAMVPLDHPLAQVSGSFNAVFVEGMASGSLMLYGRGAGGMPTASAVLGDIIDVARNALAKTNAPAPSRELGRTVIDIASLRSAFYVSLDVADQPGVLAAVAKVFGDHNVSIRSMEQVGLGDEARLIFVTHEATERDFAATIDALEKMDVVDSVGGILRVIADEEAGE